MIVKDLLKKENICYPVHFMLRTLPAESSLRMIDSREELEIYLKNREIAGAEVISQKAVQNETYIDAATPEMKLLLYSKRYVHA